MTVVYNFLKNLILGNQRFLALFYFFIGSLFATANIIIMNEETIIALCFVLFVSTLYVYGRVSILNSLTERSGQISKGFDNFFNLHLQNLELLISFYKKQNNLLTKVNSVSEFSKKEILTVIEKKEKSLNSLIVLQIEQKLSSILTKEMAIFASIQSEIVKLFTTEICEMFLLKSANQQQLKEDVTNESIKKLELLSTK